MPDLSGMGDLVLTVGGDITPLTSALDEIPAAAQQAASQIQAAFDALPSATEGVNQSLANLSTGLSEAGTQASAAGEQLSLLGDDVKALESSAQGNLFSEWSNGLQEVGGAANEAAGHIEQMPPALHDTAGAAHEAESSFGEFIKTSLELAGIVISLEAIKEATIGALETFGEFQRASEALTAITHNATGAADAMERIPKLANALGISITSLEMAQQKFALFGVDLKAMPPLFEAIANASVASGNSFDAVASSFERMDNTGKVMARTLQAAGLNMSDLAKAMDMEGATSKEVTKAFADLGEGAAGAAARAEVLIAATQKMAGVARATADDVTGSWNQMKNAVHEAMVNIGDSISQLSQAGGMSVLKSAIAGVETFVVSLIGYLGQAIDLVRGFAKIAGDEFTAIGKAAGDVAHGEFAKAWADIKAGDEQMVLDFGAMSTKMQGDWAANGKIIDKIWADTSTEVNSSSAKIGEGLKGAGDAASGATDAVEKLTKAQLRAMEAAIQFQGPIYQANLGIEMYSGAMKDATDRTSVMVNGIEILNGKVSTIKDTFDAARVKIVGFSDAMKLAITDAASFTAHLNAIANAATSAVGPIQAAGAAAMAAAHGNVGSGSLADSVRAGATGFGGQGGSGTIQGQPGDVVTQRNEYGAIISQVTLGLDALKQVQANYVAHLQALAAAAKAQTDAAAALQLAAQQQQDAANKAADALKMQNAVSQGMIGATNSLNSSALAAADAANQQAFDNSVFASVMTQVNTVTAGTAQALSIATNTMIGAASVVAQIATKAGVQFFSGTLTPAFGSQLALPNVSPSGPSGAYSPVGMPFAAPAFASGPQSNVTVSVNGSQFVQSLMNEFVRNLQTQGIRLTRG